MGLEVLSNTAKTEVGSYFVSNYPPYSVWRREHVPAALEVLNTRARQRHSDQVAREPAPVRADASVTNAASEDDRPTVRQSTIENRKSKIENRQSPIEYRQSTIENRKSKIENPPAPLGLYVHVPFCRKRCKFCYFRVYTDKNSRDVDTYMQALADEIALYKNTQRLAGRQFEFVYFGGGTPSFLSSRQLETLIERINRHWRWDAAREVTFECEPGTLRKSKLESIKKIGVTRLSLGVEHFNDEILERNGRAHLSAEIFRSYDWAREVAFDQINIDLIAGMVGESDASWQDTVEKALRLEPDSVTIYQMELPHNAVFSEELHETGSASLVATWDQKRAWVDSAFRQFEAAGYVVSSGYTLVKPSGNGRFVYRDALWRGADLIGTGVASFSHVAGVHFQNHDRWDDYLGAVQRGELPLNRALPITDHQRLIRELSLQTKTGRLDAGYFRDKFGVEILDAFRAAFDSLVADGFATIGSDRVELTRAGLLRVDGLLPRFFEPQYRNIRYT